MPVLFKWILQEGRMKKQERKQNFGIGKALLFVMWDEPIRQPYQAVL